MPRRTPYRHSRFTPPQERVYVVGDAVAFTDSHTPRGTVAAHVAEVLDVPSGRLYALTLDAGGQCSPVFPDELTPKE
jgi:hypothetical protein